MKLMLHGNSNRSNSQQRNSYNNHNSCDSSSPPKYPIKCNPIGCDRLPFQCHIRSFIVHFSGNCPEKTENLETHRAKKHLIKHVLQIYSDLLKTVHLMCTIACTPASTQATSLTPVKNSILHLCLTHLLSGSLEQQK